MYDATLAETVTIRGDGGDEIEAYLARPMSQGPFGGVVVIHHMPGYDAPTKEIARRFAEHGYNALMPNLYYRDAPGASPDDAAATARAQGGVPDARLIGDVAGAAAHLRALTSSNGKVGVIGYCSGGRQSVLAACSLPLDAAVDCYGAFVVGTPPEGMPLKVGPIKHLIKDLSCPLLGLFGADDQHPSPEQVNELEEELKAQGKTYEFHSYEGAGHAFFAVNRTAYRPEAAVDGWEKIFTWFGRYLAYPTRKPSLLTRHLASSPRHLSPPARLQPSSRHPAQPAIPARHPSPAIPAPPSQPRRRLQPPEPHASLQPHDRGPAIYRGQLPARSRGNCTTILAKAVSGRSRRPRC